MGKMTSKQASQKKELWHAEERTFNAFFGNKNTRETNFSDASADNYISNEEYQNIIKTEFPNIEDFYVSLKSWVTWQFHLGRIDELSNLDNIKIEKTLKWETKVIHELNFEEQKIVLMDYWFWNKYLWKWNLLCYNDKEKKYTFFDMSDVIDFIINNIRWELLETWRIKWHLKKNWKSMSVITFEYRSDKHQFVLWAHWGKAGYTLFEILLENLKSYEVNFNSKIIDEKLLILPKRRFNPKIKAKIGTAFFDEDYLYIYVDDNKWKRIKMEDI